MSTHEPVPTSLSTKEDKSSKKPVIAPVSPETSPSLQETPGAVHQQQQLRRRRRRFGLERWQRGAGGASFAIPGASAVGSGLATREDYLHASYGGTVSTALTAELNPSDSNVVVVRVGS